MLSKLLPILSGVAAGVITSLVISRVPPKGDPRANTVVEMPVGVLTSGPAHRGAQGRPALHPLEEPKPRRLEAWLPEEAPASTGPEAAEPPQEQPETSPEEQRAILIKEHEDAIEAHRRAPQDRRWASSTEAILERDLEALSDGMKVHSVDCKTQTCIATFEWANFADAVSGYGAVLHGSLEAGCGRRILLPEPSDPTIPYQATAFFECGASREQVAQD
jgi:hypothetical protein